MGGSRSIQDRPDWHPVYFQNIGLNRCHYEDSGCNLFLVPITIVQCHAFIYIDTIRNHDDVNKKSILFVHQKEIHVRPSKRNPCS